MFEAYKQRSDVTSLLWQIDKEYEAAQSGLSGLAQGISQHRYITARMERIGELHAQLHALVGNDSIALMDTWVQVHSSNESTSNRKE